MSFMNDVMNVILKVSHMKDIQDKKIESGIDKMMLRKPKAKQLRGLTLADNDFQGRTVSHLMNDSISKELDIIYLHGGCYALQMQSGHWNLTCSIARETGANVYVIDYPLIPEHSDGEASEYVLSYYRHHIETSDNPVILMGDSAGAGLAVSATMMMRDAEIKAPERLILLSPYLDTLCTDSRQIEYQKKDFFLSVEGLRKAGRLYIGKLDDDDFRVNPIHGDFRDLPPMIIFTSDRDILHVDSLRLVEILDSLNAEYELYEEHDVMHDWLIIEQLPEAIEARKVLYRYIQTI
jgi:acetyl esterase/lipase